MKYASKPERMMHEEDTQEFAPYEHQFHVKAPNGFKQKSHSHVVNQTRMNLLDSIYPQTANNVQVNNINPPRESIHFFYSRDQQMTSKTVEVPWISFDFDKEFGSQDQLFERITPCYH